MEVKTFPADAVIFCTGGIGAIFGRSTNSVVCTGSAQSALFQQGVDYANGEFIQVHPTAIPGEDKLRLMSESARGEGGRVWVPKNSADKRATKSIPESERFYFLEEWYPKYGNLVPRDIATRAIHRIVYQEKLGIDGQAAVYLDVTHIPRETLNRKLEGILDPKILKRSACIPISSPANIASQVDSTIRDLFWYLPPAEKAAELRSVYFRHAAWMFVHPI